MTTDARPKCLVFIATSLDGYIARADGSIEWLHMVELEGEDYGFKAFMDGVDAVVMGRKTYDTVAGFDGPWPYEGKRLVVLTHRASDPKHGETFYAGEVAALVEQLGREGVRNIYIDGGEVVTQFLKAELVDRMTVSLIPTTLGAGRPLFCGGHPERRWTLEHSRAWPTGLVQVTYAPRPA